MGKLMGLIRQLRTGIWETAEEAAATLSEADAAALLWLVDEWELIAE